MEETKEISDNNNAKENRKEEYNPASFIPGMDEVIWDASKNIFVDHGV